MSKILNIFWFRKDLRTVDNKALQNFIVKLTNDSHFCLIYIKNPDTYNYFGQKRISFLLKCLEELDNELAKFRLNLQVFYGKSKHIFEKISEHYNTINIYCNAQVEPYALERDKIIQNLVFRNNGSFNVYSDSTIIDFEQIKTKNEKPYTVFTPFKKKFLMLVDNYSFTSFKCNLNKLIGKNEIKLNFLHKFDLKNKYERISNRNKIKGGRKSALSQLKEFSKFKICRYKYERDFPSKPSTSLLSPHIHFGTISIRECFKEALKVTGNLNDPWINELVWREFYYNITFNFPEIINKSFKAKYNIIQWKNDELKFEKWCMGLTGFPIVDAGMRQLRQEGWMHNRLRMITAMFLTKDLLIDWRYGENYFAQNLIDLDFSSNNGGWQWSASTGCDAQPYFRIFNPELQSRKFDPEGIYIKKYIPELKFVDYKYIHNPSLMDRTEQLSAFCILGKDYPKPVVNHSIAKEEAIKRFRKIKEIQVKK